MTADEKDFFQDVLHDDQPESTLRSGAAMRLRGQSDDGLVRTTGWLRLGGRHVSSGLVAAVVGLLVSLVPAAALLPNAVASGACVLGAPFVGFLLWRLTVTAVLPASRARTIGSRSADRLVAGQWVRLYGRNGPIGKVAAVTTRDDSAVVELVGGSTRTFSATQEVFVAELR